MTREVRRLSSLRLPLSRSTVEPAGFQRLSKRIAGGAGCLQPGFTRGVTSRVAFERQVDLLCRTIVVHATGKFSRYNPRSLANRPKIDASSLPRLRATWATRFHFNTVITTASHFLFESDPGPDYTDKMQAGRTISSRSSVSMFPRYLSGRLW